MKALLLLSCWTVVSAHFSLFNATIGGNSTGPPPKPPPPPTPPPPKPKPTPFPPPNVGADPVTVISVKEAKVYSASSRSYSRFGHAVASYGTTLAVGYAGESTASTVDVFALEVSGSTDLTTVTSSTQAKSTLLQPVVNVTWHQAQQLYVSAENAYYDGYGRAVALGSSSLAVGAPFSTVDATFSAGVVHAYGVEGGADGAVLATGAVQSLTAGELGNVNMQFGAALAMQNTTLVVGAPGANVHGRLSGAVFVYTFDESARLWTDEVVLHDEEDGDIFANFGCSVALSAAGSELAVGASGYSKQVLHGGAVYLYARAPVAVGYGRRRAEGGGNDTADDDGQEGEDDGPLAYGWVLSSFLAPSALPPYAHFGHTVALRDSIALVSAYDAEGSGIVYLYQKHGAGASSVAHHGPVFLRRSASVGSVPSWVLSTVLSPLAPSPANQFGAALAIFHTSDASEVFPSSEEVTLQDAYVAVVGAPGDSTGAAGSLYMYMSSPDRVWRLIGRAGAQEGEGYEDYDQYGSSVALMGPHLLVGAQLANTAGAGRVGAVYLEVSLLPYLVAAAQSEGEVPGEAEGGSGGQRSGLWAFFTSSGGIVALSFLPIAALAMFFVVHKKAKGEKVMPKTSLLHRLCGDGPSNQQLLPSVDPDRTKPVAANETDTFDTVTESPSVLEQEQGQVQEPGQGQDHEGGVGQLIAARAWSLAQLMSWYLRGSLGAHRPIPGSEECSAAEEPAADLRVAQGPLLDGSHSTLSIRSPITHIPLHSSLMQSPRGQGPQQAGPHPAVAVPSFRLVEECRQPSPPAMGDLGAAAAELQRMKDELNREFAPAPHYGRDGDSPSSPSAGLLPGSKKAKKGAKGNRAPRADPASPSAGAKGSPPGGDRSVRV